MSDDAPLWPSWYLEAMTIGWPEDQLDELVHMLGHHPIKDQVERVTPEAIHLVTPYTVDNRRWTWVKRATEQAETPRAASSDWCPIHGNQCAHSVRGCAKRDEDLVVSTTTEEIPEQYTVEGAGPKITHRAKEPEPEPAVTPKAEKRKRGAPLPGQLSLGTKDPDRT